MRVDDVDPRDIRWGIDRPVYRVHFWWQPQPGPDSMLHCQEPRLHVAQDVDEVSRWAGQHGGDRITVVYVEAHDDSELRLLRLHGQDPSAAPSEAGPGQVAFTSG